MNRFNVVLYHDILYLFRDERTCGIGRKNPGYITARLQTAFMTVTLFISEATGYIIYLARKLCSWIRPVYRLAFGGRPTAKSVHKRTHAPAIFTRCAALSCVPLIASIRIVYRLRSPRSYVILSVKPAVTSYTYRAPFHFPS